MPDTDTGTSTPAAAIRPSYEGEAPVHDTGPLALPFDRFALLVSLETTGSAVVTAGSDNLLNTARPPFETSPHADILARDMSLAANKEELARTGLSRLFPPDTGASVVVVQLRYDESLAGALLVETTHDQTAENVKELCDRNEAAVRKALALGRSLTRTYEWQMLKATHGFIEPCLIVDPAHRVSSANVVLCELVGLPIDEIAGGDLSSLIQIQQDIGGEFPRFPAYHVLTSPIFVRTRSLFFTSGIHISTLPTACGERLVIVFSDLLTDMRTGNSNIQLVEKLSSIIMERHKPPVIIRKLLNVLTMTLQADLICILRRKENDELVVTPYSNRRLETLSANFIEPTTEPVLEPYFSRGIPVLCEEVQQHCSEASFFRRILPLSRFAFLPTGRGTDVPFAVLMGWSSGGPTIGAKALPLLSIIANLFGAVLSNARLLSEIQQEKDALRRYARLTTGRELRMASLKRENARLRELITKLSGTTEVQHQ